MVPRRGCGNGPTAQVPAREAATGRSVQQPKRATLTQSGTLGGGLTRCSQGSLFASSAGESLTRAATTALRLETRNCPRPKSEVGRGCRSRAVEN